jgi:hypothetical protein
MAEGYYFLWILYSDRFQKHKQWIIPCIVIKKKNKQKLDARLGFDHGLFQGGL